MIENYALTIAYPLVENDFLETACQTITSKLDQYNLAKTGLLPKRKIIYIDSQHPSLYVADICQQSISIDNHIDQEIVQSILLSHPEFLITLQAKAYEWGAKRFFTWCYEGSVVERIFLNAGFHLCGQFPDLMEGRTVLRFYKDLENISPNLESALTITLSQDEFHESYEELNPYHSNQSHNSFGIFMADQENKNLKAGLFGSLYQSPPKGIPHGEILCLWVDVTLRHKGLGTRLMEEAETLLRQFGAQYVQLATNGFQAPEFYQKRGFDMAESCPQYYQLADRSYSIFDCTKKL